MNFRGIEKKTSNLYKNLIQQNRQAMTLVEVAVVLGVTSVLLLGIAQMTQSVMKSTLGARQNGDLSTIVGQLMTALGTPNTCPIFNGVGSSQVLNLASPPGTVAVGPLSGNNSTQITVKNTAFNPSASDPNVIINQVTYSAILNLTNYEGTYGSGGSTSYIYTGNITVSGLRQSGYGGRTLSNSSNAIGIRVYLTSSKEIVSGMSCNALSGNYVPIDGGTMTGSLYLTNGSQIGIRTTNPEAVLDVGGSSQNSLQTILARYPGDPQFELGTLNANNSSNSSGSEIFKLGQFYNGSWESGLRFQRGSGAGDTSIIFNTNNADRGFVDGASGKLIWGNYIGVSTFPSYPLDVAATGGNAPTNNNHGACTGSGCTTLGAPFSGAVTSVSIHAAGAIISETEIDAYSDRRSKKNIESLPLEKSLDFLRKAQPVTYQLKSESQVKKHFGFIAQDILKAGFPEFVGVLAKKGIPELIDPDGFRSPKDSQYVLNYSQMTSILTRSAQYFLEKITGHDEMAKRLQDQLDAKEKQIRALEQENVEIRKYLCSKDSKAPFCRSEI